jgi:hypothetical protein
MRLARTTPGIGELPELRTYDCNACGVVPGEPSGQAEIARPRGSYRYSLVFEALPRSVIDGVPFVASGG